MLWGSKSCCRLFSFLWLNEDGVPFSFELRAVEKVGGCTILQTVYKLVCCKLGLPTSTCLVKGARSSGSTCPFFLFAVFAGCARVLPVWRV